MRVVATTGAPVRFTGLSKGAPLGVAKGALLGGAEGPPPMEALLCFIRTHKS